MAAVRAARPSSRSASRAVRRRSVSGPAAVASPSSQSFAQRLRTRNELRQQVGAGCEAGYVLPVRKALGARPCLLFIMPQFDLHAHPQVPTHRLVTFCLYSLNTAASADCIMRPDSGSIPGRAESPIASDLGGSTSCTSADDRRRGAPPTSCQQCCTAQRRACHMQARAELATGSHGSWAADGLSATRNANARMCRQPQQSVACCSLRPIFEYALSDIPDRVRE